MSLHKIPILYISNKSYASHVCTKGEKVFLSHFQFNSLLIYLQYFLSVFCFNYNCCTLCSSRVIWLGDLNYRIALNYRSAKALVEMQNWRVLLENDQVC